jgi:hypothetical protein
MDDDYSEKINIDELYTRKREIEGNKLKIFRNILNRVHKKIKVSSRQTHNLQYTFFIIPEFIVGIPTYDIAACTAFIIDKLKENGFIVKYTYPNLLFISWAHHLDKAKRNEIKKVYGINVNSKGEVINKDEKNSNTANTNNNPNGLLLKDKKMSVANKKDYKNISDYKPTGNLIYNTALIGKIEENVRN